MAITRLNLIFAFLGMLSCRHAKADRIKASPYSIAGRTTEPITQTPRELRGFGGPAESTLAAAAHTLEETAFKVFAGMPQVLSLYIMVFSLATVIPFAWFTFAGQATVLFNWYRALALGFAAQTFVITLLASFEISDILVTVAGVVAAVGGAYYSYMNGAYADSAAGYWFGVIWGALIMNLGAFYVRLSNQVLAWGVYLLIGLLIHKTYPLIDLDRSHKQGFGVTFISAYGFVSSLTVILTLLGVSGGFDFFTFFSVPSNLTASLANVGLLITMAVSVAFGTYVQTIRDKELRAN